MSLADFVSTATTGPAQVKPLCNGHARLYGGVDVGKDLCHACYSVVR